MNASALILFVKSPVSGRVKTRLAASIGDLHARNLYVCFVRDVVRTAKQIKGDLHIFYHPPHSIRQIKDVFGVARYCQPQTGKDLGEKMSHAFGVIFRQHYRRALLIGSDTPDLPKEILDDAMSALNHHGAVIGPSVDGGYYLIGFRSETFTATVFEHIAWSTGEVYAETLKNFSQQNLAVHCLPIWQDVDNRTDLKDLSTRLMLFPFRAPETFRYLQNLQRPLFVYPSSVARTRT